jgi:hypothetical protein
VIRDGYAMLEDLSISPELFWTRKDVNYFGKEF